MASDLREVTYRDAFGKKWTTLIGKDEPDSAARTGIPVGPIGLDDLGLPLPFEVKLHNELHDRRIFTYADVSARGGIEKVAQALRQAIKLGAHEIAEHYREQSGGVKP